MRRFAAWFYFCVMYANGWYVEDFVSTMHAIPFFTHHHQLDGVADVLNLPIYFDMIPILKNY